MTRLALLSCALLVACGGGGLKQQTDPVLDFAGIDLAPKGTDDGGGVDLSGGGFDLAGKKADMAMPDMAMAFPPVITLTSPTMAVKSNDLMVTVSVASPAMRTITGVTMLVGSSTTPVTLSQITSGVWQGATDVTSIASGTVPVVVTATDTASITGTLTTSVLLDHGPTIMIIEPTAPTARNTIAFEAVITDPLGKTLDPANVTVGVQSPNDTTFTYAPLTASSSITISGQITFSSFSPALTGNQVITFTATNMDGATATAQKTFTIDQTGPTISIQTPAENAFAGGLITIQATIDDPSGVDPASVSAAFASGGSTFTVALAPVASGSDMYAALYNLTALGDNFSYPTITVSANDLLGNPSTPFSQSFYLDNSKPILSLNPPKFRVRRSTDGVCSEAFNPVGDDVVTDLENSVLQAITLRARVEDQANTVSGQTVIHPSGMNLASVRLVATPASTANGAQPVLVVNDQTVPGSTDCNAINPLLTSVSSGAVSQGQYLSLPMAPLTSLGSPNYSPDTNNVPGYCTAVGDTGATAPLPLCGHASDLSYTLEYLDDSTVSIWSLPSVTNAPDPQCVGQQFDDGNLPEGWTCFAAIGTDNTGNHAVSPPLRACIRRPNSPLNPHPCDTQAANPPACTGTYTAPVGSTPGSTDPNTPCQPVNFSDVYRDI